jgi:membrane protease YdiL (CAAX protease family)
VTEPSGPGGWTPRGLLAGLRSTADGVAARLPRWTPVDVVVIWLAGQLLLVGAVLGAGRLRAAWAVYPAAPLSLLLATYVVLSLRRSWPEARSALRWTGGSSVALGGAAGVVLWAVAQAAAAGSVRLGLRLQPNNPLVTSPAVFLHSPALLSLLSLAVLLLAPLAEELFYRGLLYGYLRSRWGPAPAVVVSALLFGLAHADLSLLLPLALVGAGLALVYERAGGLWPSIAAHAALNVLSLGFAYATLVR